MKNFLLNKQIMNDLLLLLNNYTDNVMPPTDYLNMTQGKILIQDEHYESVVEMFLLLVQHRQLFSDFIDHFHCLGKRKDHNDKHFLMVLTCILIFFLNATNKEDVIDICKEENHQKIVNFLRFFNKDSIIEKLFVMGCQYFEEKYIREKMILNIKKNQELLEDMQQQCEKMLALQKAVFVAREPTRPVTPRVTAHMRQGPPPPVPTNTPEEMMLPPAKPPPTSTYKPSKISEVLEKLREEHKTSSKLLLEEANEATKRLSSVLSNKHQTCSIKEEPVIQHMKIYKSHKVSKTNIPVVKKNAATILREAARLIKEEEKDIKRMNDLVSGAADHSSYEEMMDQVRAQEEQLHLEDVERKHLLGQLTREEAFLARQRILDLNKAKRAQIEKEKKETEEVLRKMRRKQEDEIRRMIDKTQQTQKNIEARKQELIHRKQMEAQEVANTSKQLYAEAMMRQKQELEKRIQIIKEIKALSSIKDLEANKFDPTETMNVGLLCEMSLAELYDRLLIKRANIKEEIEKRQMCIRRQKLKQQQFLAETQQFIDVCREQKKLLDEKKSSTYKQLQMSKSESQDIKDLRERLEKARKQRTQFTNN